MSDLLIKNLDIPKSFQRLRLTILPDGSVCRIEPFTEAVLPTEAKAEILTEHGDLIDRDYLLAMIDLYLFTAKKIGRENKGLEIFKKEIENAPVILPSNRVSTEKTVPSPKYEVETMLL